jgi:uncharacterized protein (DUF983 family)
MSYSIDVGASDECPACDKGKLRLAAGERVPRSGAGAPRTLTCDSCGWSMTSPLHGPDDHSPGGC